MANSESSSNVTLASLRSKHDRKPRSSSWWRKHAPWLFDIHSLFYYGLFVFILGMLWCIYSLVTNHFTQFYPWTDYTGQYVTFAHSYWDAWHGFFHTGVFELYSTDTYLGSDNIGSNSYYGLFDPFLLICLIFPRAWIPQTYVLATFAKGVAGAFGMRLYGKYLGMRETPARLAGLAFAFNGYLNFMVGFPSVVSATCLVPWILLGIEKVIRERKPLTLAISLCAMGLVSFFFLVVLCIFGVLYALWRYFWTIRSRSWKENLLVIAVGVGAFAAGIMLCAWTLFPSLRESSLSGRTVSIGAAYLHSLENAIKTLDFHTLFQRLFELVGQHPARELQGLIGFFYPTYGYLALPIASGANGSGGIQYDAWVASLFTYTPTVVLFWVAFVSSCRRKKISHVLAFVFLAYFVFTDFAYYFFYTFTGDGYGRWYIVLMPIIIYYAFQEFDRLKEEPKWVPFSGAALSLFLATLTWILCLVVIKDHKFEPSLTTYWCTTYSVPSSVKGHSTLWIVIYQLLMDLVVGCVYIFFRHKDVLSKIVGAIITCETIMWGNVSFAYMGTWSYTRWNGGVTYRTSVQAAFDKIDSFDGNSYYRAFVEGQPEKNVQEVFQYNGTSNFHSLFNYDVNQLALYSRFNRPEYSGTAYGETYYNKSWAAYYGNKRIGADTALNIKYYGIMNEGYSDWEGSNVDPSIGKYIRSDNVPWDSVQVTGEKGERVRVYRSSLIDENSFAHAVDHFYAAGKSNDDTQEDNFYHKTYDSTKEFAEINRNEEVYGSGAIVQDKDVERLTALGVYDHEGNALAAETAPEAASLLTNVTVVRRLYSHYNYNFLGPEIAKGDGTSYRGGPAYFFTDPSVTSSAVNSAGTYLPDYQTVVYTPSGKTYFNDDETGAYFALRYNISSISRYKTRIFMISDVTDETTGEVHQNQVTAYDYETLESYRAHHISGAARADVFGFYPVGKVKAICFNAKSSDYSVDSTAAIPSFSVAVGSRKDYEAFYDYAAQGNNITNCRYSTDMATFDSSFDHSRLVATTLGYDAGWKVYATTASGESTQCPTFKLDGGFVGFVAPAGEVRYTMKYQTPYLKEGAIMASVAVLGLAAYTIGRFLYSVHKEKKTPEA